MPQSAERSGEAAPRTSVLFGLERARNEAIRARVDSQAFDVHFAEFTRQTPFERYELVVPLLIQEIRLLQQSFDHLNGRHFLVPPPAALETAHHKPSFNRFIRERFSAELLPAEAGRGDFPYVLKKAIDAGGEHAHLVRTADDEKRLGGLLDDPAYFRQAYVSGATEYTDHLLYDAGIRYSCRVEFRMNREFYIRGTRMQPYHNVQISVGPTELDALWSDILAALGFRGLCCFNYKLIGGRPVLFELNPRFGGSLPHDLNRMLASLRAHLRGESRVDG